MDEPNAETNNNNDSNAGEGDDDFDFKPDSAGDDTNKLRARAQQGSCKPRDIVCALDKWIKYKGEKGDNKRGFAKMIRDDKINYNRPKFIPRTLHCWLEKEEQYRESTRSQNEDYRTQGLL